MVDRTLSWPKAAAAESARAGAAPGRDLVPVNSCAVRRRRGAARWRAAQPVAGRGVCFRIAGV